MIITMQEKDGVKITIEADLVQLDEIVDQMIIPALIGLGFDKKVVFNSLKEIVE